MPPTVFISYSHKDEAWKDRLVTHLAGLERTGRLRTWNDRLIRAGQEWLPKIEAAMKEARVAVLLVSPEFLSSEFIQAREVPPLLKRRAREGVHVVPVIVKDCLWEEDLGIASLQARPRDGRALETIARNRWNTELKKIAKEILELLGDDASPQAVPETNVEPPRTTTLAALHQLPPPPADFTGREEDLAELRAAVESEGINISGVRGMGGIGKTALALKLADELTPRYPDAQIYLDLQGVSTNPVPPAQAMAHVIRAFHPESPLPEGDSEIQGLYRSVLHGKRALLLMDNTAGRAQVEPLVPPTGNVLLVTSRFLFHLPGLRGKDLDELPLEDARALLLRITPRIGKDADRIAEICAGLPFALLQAAGTLSERPDLVPARYAEQLAGEKARLGLVEASLRLSYDSLSEELACRWRTLGVFPATFDTAAAAAVWEVEQAEAETTLGDLVRRSLADGEDGRYRLHDLARVFANNRMPLEERTKAGNQHAVHYRNLLAQADYLYLKGGPSVLLGLRLIDVEWVNIQAGQAWAATHASEDLGMTELAAEYPGAGSYCLNLRLRPREQIRWLETALETTRLLNDRSGESRTLGNLGVAYRILGETHRAIKFYEQQLAIAREIGDRRGEGAATGNLGLSYVALGETSRAIEFCEQHLAIAREIGDRRGEGVAIGNLGSAYADLGETRRAIELFEQRIALAREIGDRKGEGAAIGNLGNAYADLDEARRAMELYEQQLSIVREIGDRGGERIACWNLGLALKELGELDRAAELMQVCVDYERDIGHPDADKHAAVVETLRARIAAESASPPKLGAPTARQ